MINPKKYINCILVSIILSIPGLCHGQAALLILIFGDKVASEEFHLSLDMGLNFASMNGFDDGSMAISPNFGLGTHIKINDRWHLAPEIKFLSRKGARDVSNPIKLADEFEGSETDSRIRLNYFEIPVLLQYKFENGLYFSAGPQISFLSEALQKTEIILADETMVDVEQDLKDDFQNIDFSFPVEVAYGIKSIRGGKGMDLRLRYTHGFNELFEESTSFSANNSTVQFILTFPFVEYATDEIE